MNKNYFFLIILLFLSSCQNVKNALSGKKYENSDEFLVIKKNPLVLPPNFNELPEPGKTKTSEINNNESFEEKILSKDLKNENQEANSSANSTEELILKNIKKNDSN